MIRNWRWTIAAVGVWLWALAVVVPAVLGQLIPADRYMVSSTFVVSNTFEGVPPQVLSDRVIVRDHERDIHVTVRGLGEQAGYVCDRISRDVPARAGAPFPSDMTLDRLMGVTRGAQPCRPMGAGDYTVEVTYTIDGPLGSRIKVGMPGAPFVVAPR